MTTVTDKSTSYPAAAASGPAERLELVSRKVFRGRMKGERRSKRKGQSVEFADFRQYVPGDDLRSSIGTCSPGWSGCISNCFWKKRICTSIALDRHQ